MDVISHLPVLCEEHHVPYCFVPSRVELGMAGLTKRPTSVVMVGAKPGRGKEGGEKVDAEAWAEEYKGLLKVVRKLEAQVTV